MFHMVMIMKWDMQDKNISDFIKFLFWKKICSTLAGDGGAGEMADADAAVVVILVIATDCSSISASCIVLTFLFFRFHLDSTMFYNVLHYLCQLPRP